MPDLKSQKEYLFKKHVSITNLFGFYYCEIDAPKDSYLGLLPKKKKIEINRRSIFLSVNEKVGILVNSLNSPNLMVTK